MKSLATELYRKLTLNQFLVTTCKDSLFDKEIMSLTEVDRIDTKKPKALSASLLTVLCASIKLHFLASLDEAKLGSQKDIIAFSGSLEPFP